MFDLIGMEGPVKMRAQIMTSINEMSESRVDITLAERDAVKLILEFFQQRELYISMLDIERETGIINGAYSEDILFLRQLIFDGQWDDVIEFIQPLKNIDSFNAKQFIYVILKYQFLELLCLKTEANVDNDLSVEQIVKFLHDLQPFAPDEQEYKKLSFLLTLTRIQDHADYHNWNPNAGRVQCFLEVLPLVEKFLQVEKPTNPIAQGDRLIQLLVKGLIYESCVEHCQARATGTEESIDLADANSLLSNSSPSDMDASLISWLHALPTETFSCPFEQKSLALNINPLQKPTLEAAWAEHVLSTPFKPQTLFPFNATPSGKPRSTELMSRSLIPQYDGSSYSLIGSQIFNDPNRSAVNETSRSLAIFNLEENERTEPTGLPTVEEISAEEISPPPSHYNDRSSNADGLLKEYQKNRTETVKQSVVSNPKIRPVNDKTKYDSLENILDAPTFIPLVSLEDPQVIRSVDVHPSGKYFAVGSNSKTIRVCAYPDLKYISTDSLPKPAKVLYKKGRHHLGSIYCMGWSPSGKILATGSNDKSIKLVRLDMERPEDDSNNAEMELTFHNGTIRDLIFMQDDTTLLSGGAGDCKLYVTDLKKQTPMKSYAGHQGYIYSIFAWDASTFASASQDGTTRLWDIRQSECIHSIPSRSPNTGAAAVAVDSSGQLLATGYEDSCCLLYDLRGRRIVQVYEPHTSEIRSVRFSAQSSYLLTASYDKHVVMTHLQGDLTKPLVLSTVAAHTDKIIQARWHPNEISFVTTSVDRTCIVWGSSPSSESTLVESF